jgi:hypothetical protein
MSRKLGRCALVLSAEAKLVSKSEPRMRKKVRGFIRSVVVKERLAVVTV